MLINEIYQTRTLQVERGEKCSLAGCREAKPGNLTALLTYWQRDELIAVSQGTGDRRQVCPGLVSAVAIREANVTTSQACQSGSEFAKQFLLKSLFRETNDNKERIPCLISFVLLIQSTYYHCYICI